ncbi:NADPH-dependent FMN reductase [Pseudonocardia acidicola]|uniref:NADPH-dependent oxidoreductase n=1 Tax=Pseudonocardia acidicola TaxID=2724939 RepID=A0ABX1SA46_9PSEU|nr:NAD(P)H-dependent oxidoreductase [Pseudonocardia acidicola]NMH97338.1 NADPH-dependent oxidoreductase [Pseudonocardia acidicola]
MEQRLRIVTVVGNPKANSRTRTVGEEVARQIAVRFDEPDRTEHDTIELADLAAELFDRSSPRVAKRVRQVSNSSVAVFVSPIYKAAYTGLLKAFLDWFDRTSLQDAVVVPVMVGAAPHHALAVEVHLRPLLVEIGGIAPTRGLYVIESQIDDLDSTVARWMTEAGPVIGRTVLERTAPLPDRSTTKSPSRDPFPVR